MKRALVSTFVAGFLLSAAVPGRAEYIGLEPERLERLRAATEDAALDLSISLLEEGKAKEALEEAERAARSGRWVLRYAHALLQLRGDPDVRFSEVRAELATVLAEDPLFAEVFEVWLGLNPTEKELRGYLEALSARTELLASWQRAEVLIRLGDARAALASLQGLEPDAVFLRNRLDLLRARAYFLQKSDAAGQGLYGGILERLDGETAELLFRDAASIATRAERERFESLTLDGKADFFRGFWGNRHPLPGREVNPRLAEHYRRLEQALSDYALQSTGRGYFTDREVFQRFSPELAYYSSEVMFENGPASRYWTDARGLMLIRHGEPDGSVKARSFAGSDLSESWVVNRPLSRPLVFNFVRRAGVNEWVLALNLGVAATTVSVADDPQVVAQDLTPAYRELYQSRLFLHQAFRGVVEARSAVDRLRALQFESQLMAAFARAALDFDSTAYFTRENILPLAVSVSNFYLEGQPAILVDFAVDLQEVEPKKIGPSATLEAKLLAFDRDWKNLRASFTRTFELGPLPSGKSRVFLGRLQLEDLDPEEYRLSLQLYQPESGRVGVAKGRHATSYVHSGNLEVSDLLLQQRRLDEGKKSGETPEDDASLWLPAPTRVVSRKSPIHLEFELYNLRADDSGTARYEVEEKILTLYEKPGVFSQVLGYGQLFGQAVFPLYTFIGQVGAFALSQATADETDGIVAQKRSEEKSGSPTVVRESLDLNLQDLKPGVYTVYVTVRDRVSEEITSRFLTLQIV
jgi:GWxTD domain-containing protein